MMYTPRLTILIISIIACSMFFIPTDAANLGGYTIEPVTPGMYTGTPLETTEVSFWELPLQVIILSLALTISPVLEFTLELLLFARFYIFLGYRKIVGGNLLFNDTRDRVYHCIRENPGIFFNSMVRKTGIKPGTLRYHLLVLNSMKKISVLDSQGDSRYFENSGMFSEMEKSVLKHVQNDTDNRILRLLLEDHDLNRKDLGERLGISGVMVTWYTKRLNGAGIISLQKTGKNARYEINPDVRQYLEKYLIPNREAVHLNPMEQVPESA